MGQISSALALEETIEHKGVTYKLAPLTLEVQGQWEQWLENRAWEALARRRQNIGDYEYRQLADSLTQAITAGEYSFFSEASKKTLAGVHGLLGPGLRQMLFLRLRLNHPEVSKETIWDMIEVRAEELIRKMNSQDAEAPNAEAPAAETPATAA